MKLTEHEIKRELDKILSSQSLAVLSTQRKGQPYSSLMAFAHSPDLSFIVSATGSSTRKFNNIVQDSRVSLLVDTRSNNETDFHEACAVTIIGTASVENSKEEKWLTQLYQEKHPYLETFLRSPSTSIITVSVSHYLLVSRFQHVMEYHITDGKDIFS